MAAAAVVTTPAKAISEIRAVSKTGIAMLDQTT
jgi:hypothetical protein